MTTRRKFVAGTLAALLVLGGVACELGGQGGETDTPADTDEGDGTDGTTGGGTNGY